MGGFLNSPLMGLILLVAAFGLLIWNEGKVDMSQIAATSTELASETVTTDTTMNGKLVSVSGALTTGELVGDGQYLKPGPYVSVERTVEMYSWLESSSSTQTAGSQETVSTPTYNKQWTARPVDARMFKVPAGHENPVMVVASLTKKAQSAKVGAYSVDMSTMKVPDSMKPLQLTNDNIMFFPGMRIEGTDLLFIGRGTPSNPEIGDLRIKYKVLQGGATVTAFGGLRGQTITAYTDASNNTLASLVLGNRNQALADMKNQQVMMTWVARVVGLLILWGAMIIFFKPTGVIGKAMPSVAAMSSMTMRIVTLIIAVVLTIVGVLVGTSIAG